MEKEEHAGVVHSVRGSVVDVQFETELPPIFTILHVGDKDQFILEVLSQRDEKTLRCIALTSTGELARGMIVQDTGAPLKAPVGKAILSRMFDVFGNTID